MGKTKPRENRNGAGNPRNARAARNQAKNDKWREEKAAAGGVGAYERRKQAAKTTRKAFIDSLKPVAENEVV